MQPYTTGLTGLFPFSPTEAAFIVTELAERGLTASVTEDDILIDGVGSYLTVADPALIVRLLDIGNHILRDRDARAQTHVPAIQGYRAQPQENLDFVNVRPGEAMNPNVAPIPAPIPAIGYRQLTPEDVALMNEAKAAVNAYGAVLDKLGAHPDTDKRWLAIARTDAQTSCMAACRAITRPTSFA